MNLMCKMFGHNMVTSKINNEINPLTGEKGYTKYCDRCLYSEFVGCGEYDKKTILSKVMEQVDSMNRLATKDFREKEQMFNEKVALIKTLLGKL